MNLQIFTLVHVLISLAGLVTGLVTAGGWLAGRDWPRLTDAFLFTTLATSVTGFFFPFTAFTPAHGVGIVSLLVLAVAAYARFGGGLAGPWRQRYALASLVALYLNCFVLVAQLFQKTPALQALAPKQTEPPFALAQVLLLAGFVALGRGVRRGVGQGRG
ncbi:MAG: hypothetical protein JSR82_23265 [Verrucomicrobia bacterium]|nr:hypothetical protein [Verrucomicrobiota bacterium]